MIRKILMIAIGALLSCNFMPIATAATQSQIDFEKNRQASQQQFEQRSQQMQQQYQQGVADMQQQHQQRVAEMQQQHQQNVDEMNRKSQQRLQEMRSNNQPVATQSSTSTAKPATNSGEENSAVAPTTGNKNQPAAPANASSTAPPPSAATTVKPAAKKSTDSSVGTWLLGGGILAGGTVMALRKRKKITTAPFLAETKSMAGAKMVSIAGQNVSLAQGWQVAKEFSIKGYPVIATTGNAGIVLLVLCSGANMHISPTGWINYDEKEERYESPVKALKQMKAQLTEQLEGMNIFGEMIHLAILTTNSQAVIKGEDSIITLPMAGLDSWIGKLPKPDNCEISVLNKVITDLKWE